MSRVSVSSSPRASSFLRPRVHETRVCTHISVATRGGPGRSSPVILGCVLTSNMRPLQHLYRSSRRRHHLRALPHASVYTRRVVRVTHDPFSASLYPRRVRRRYIEEMEDTFKGRALIPAFIADAKRAHRALLPTSAYIRFRFLNVTKLRRSSFQSVTETIPNRTIPRGMSRWNPFATDRCMAVRL